MSRVIKLIIFQIKYLKITVLMELDQQERQFLPAEATDNQPAQEQSLAEKKSDSVLNNQSNLLQSTVITNPNSYDEMPIGGGNKTFMMSEFPEEGDAFKPPLKKNVVKKAPKKPLGSNHEVQNKAQLVSASKVSEEDASLPKVTQPLDEIPVGGNNINQFDEKPIAKSNFNLSEFPEGEQEPPEEKEYPMLQKLKSKAAKLRLSGMEDLIKLMEQNPDHPDIAEIDIKAMVKETTPANLDKGLQVLRMWVQKGKKWGDDEIKNAIQNGMGKVNTKKVTIEICDLMYDENPTTIQTAILLGLKGKILKNVAYYLTMIAQLLAIYGIKKMKYLKPYIPEVVKLLNDKKDIAVKNEGTNIIKEAYKWLGKDVISPMLGELKENIKKEIDAFWEGYDQTILMKAPKGEEDAEPADGKKKKKVDAYELSEAVDVFKKFNQKWSEGVLEAAKWSEKTKMLEDFVKAASVPKLANTEFRHISELIKRLINDSNFNVVIWDLRVLAVMARGLRRNFQYVVKNVFSNVLGKFRDKKTQMIQQTFTTLNDFLFSISLEEVLDDVKEGLQDKAPNMKVNVINWIGKFTEQKVEEKGELAKPALDAIKQLFSIFEKLLNDGNVEVRDCMARNIFKMKLLIGQEFFAPIEAKINKNLASKATETKTGSKPGGKKQKSPQKPKQEMSKSRVGFNKKQGQKSPLTKTQAINKGGKQQAAKQQKKPKQPELIMQRFEEPSIDDSCQKLLEYGFPEEEIKNIKISGAKERQNVMNLLKADSYDLLTTFNVMRELFKDWKEVNLLMNKELIAFIEEKSPNMDKPQIVIIIPLIIQKIGDSKFSQPLYRALENMLQKIPGTFVVGYLIQKVKALENKKPKLNTDVCSCICRVIDIVSINNIPIRQTILFANDCFKIQFSKKGAVDLIKKVYSYIADQVKLYLEPETYASLDTELKKIKLLTEDEKRPKIQFTGQAKKNQKKTLNLLENKPKVDITQKVQDLMPKINDNSNWQNRKQSAEAIIALINDNFGRVNINCINDLMNNLKPRINDPNKNVIKTFMQLTAVLFPVLSDKDLKVFTKMFITTLADSLSDKMEANKKEAALTLNKIGEVVGKQQLLATLAPYLETDKESRVEIISIMLANEEFLQKTDMKDFPKGITNCLCDKNKEIRNSAEKLFEKVYERIGIETFRNIAKNKQPAITKDLNSIFDKYDNKRETTSAYQGSQSNISKASSPAKDVKPQLMEKRNIPLSNSAKKRSESKNQKSTVEMEAEEPDYTSNQKSRVFMTEQKASVLNQGVSTLVNGDELFAPMNLLTLYRVERNEHQSQFSLEEFTDSQEDGLKEQISLLINPNLVKKMFSFNQKRVSDAILQLIKLFKEVSYQNHFREIYDLLLKWSLIRLWGGAPALLSIVEIFPPILSILEKKKLPLNDFEVDLIIAVVREYFISSFMNEFKVSDSLHIIIKSLVSLSSGERVVKKVLRQFSYELTSIHRHLKKDVNVFYRDGLSKLTKMHLMDFIGNQDTLEETSKIKELRSDPEFVEMLYRKFHETVLNHFGFRNFVKVNTSGLNQNISAQNLNQTTMPQNYPPPLPPQNTMAQTLTGLPRRERSLSNESRKREKSVERGPNMMKREVNNSRGNLDANKSKTTQNSSAVVSQQQQRNVPQNSHQFVKQQQPSYPQQQHQSVNLSNTSNIVPPSFVPSSRPNQPQSEGFSSYPQCTLNSRTQQNIPLLQPTQQLSSFSSLNINLAIYPAPHPISPLGKHLSKLVPPNDQVIKFFSELFGEHGDKISNELATHAKFIYGSILKSVMEVMQNRREYLPQKIVGQMNLFQQCIKCKNIIRNVDLELLKFGINFTLRQLVYEDENKSAIHDDLVSRGIDYKIENFIKVINGVMLRILQNGNPQDVVNTLIMINNEFIRLPERSTKTIYLIMKCTSRVAPSYTAELKLDGVIDFFVAINEYFAIDPPPCSLEEFTIPTKEKPTPTENFLHSLKAILSEICKILGSDIWELYQKAMQQAKYQDNYIVSFIHAMKVTKFTTEKSEIHDKNLPKGGNRDPEELKKISDLLSKHKTFETGILHLKKYCQMNAEFLPIDYFTSLGYDQKFINMVMNGLEGKERKTPRKDTKEGAQYAKSKSPIGNPNAISQQENIQEKIKKLKQKFSDMQSQVETTQQFEDLTTKKKILQQDKNNEKAERTVEIQRRIEEMKNRLSQNPR